MNMHNTTMDGNLVKCWNYEHLTAALIISFILQSLFLPCLCDIGTAKIMLAYVLDVLILLRISVAYFCREKCGGWKFYVWLLYTSPVWINGVAYMLTGNI